MARTGNAADMIPRNLKALRGALENSVTLQMGRLQEVVDGMVAAGSLTRSEADKLVNQLLTSSKGYSQGLLDVLDSVASEARRNVEAGVATAVVPVVNTAGKIAETVRSAATGTRPARTSTTGKSGKTGKKSGNGAKPSTAEQRVVEPISLEPIPAYGSMTVAEIKPKLSGLKKSELRRMRELETQGKARKGVLAEIDRLLDSR